MNQINVRVIIKAYAIDDTWCAHPSIGHASDSDIVTITHRATGFAAMAVHGMDAETVAALALECRPPALDARDDGTSDDTTGIAATHAWRERIRAKIRALTPAEAPSSDTLTLARLTSETLL